jgi:hypothetical protein
MRRRRLRGAVRRPFLPRARNPIGRATGGEAVGPPRQSDLRRAQQSSPGVDDSPTVRTAQRPPDATWRHAAPAQAPPLRSATGAGPTRQATARCAAGRRPATVAPRTGRTSRGSSTLRPHRGSLAPPAARCAQENQPRCSRLRRWHASCRVDVTCLMRTSAGPPPPPFAPTATSPPPCGAMPHQPDPKGAYRCTTSAMCDVFAELGLDRSGPRPG